MQYCSYSRHMAAAGSEPISGIAGAGCVNDRGNASYSKSENEGARPANENALAQ
jgi:hypothetical protein